MLTMFKNFIPRCRKYPSWKCPEFGDIECLRVCSYFMPFENCIQLNPILKCRCRNKLINFLFQSNVYKDCFTCQERRTDSFCQHFARSSLSQFDFADVDLVNTSLQWLHLCWNRLHHLYWYERFNFNIHQRCCSPDWSTSDWRFHIWNIFREIRSVCI